MRYDGEGHAAISQRPGLSGAEDITMISVAVDEKLANSLTAPATLVEVRDAAGRVIGFFAPVTMELAEKYASAAGQLYPVKPGSVSAMRRPKTTAEVLEHLRTLESGT
jgi:hypothetical protein